MTTSYELFPSLNLIDKPKPLVLLFRNYIEIFLVHGLLLTTGIDPLNPCMIPIRIEFLTGHADFPMLEGKQSSIFTESNLP